MAGNTDRGAAARKAWETRRRNSRTTLKPGQTLETALLSPVVEGHVRGWVKGDSVVWRLDDPERARRLLGRGVVARTSIERGRFREVGLVARSAGTLLLPSRLHTESAAPDQALAGAQAIPIAEKPSAPQTSAAAWAELCEWLRAVLPEAVARGEFVVIERGGWEPHPEPFAFAMCAPGPRGWMSHVEAAPPPGEGSLWPRVSQRDQKGQTVSAPASIENLRGAAALLVDAVAHWAASPLDIAVTFGTSPHGPFSASSGNAARS